MRTLGLAPILVLCLVSCAHTPPPKPAKLALGELRAPLRTSIPMRASVDGKVQNRSAEIIFDVALPLSTVTSGCFPKDAQPQVLGTARLPLRAGGYETLPEIEVSGVRVAEHSLATLVLGLREHIAPCEVILGMDVLEGHAMEIDPQRGELAVFPSRRKSDYAERAHEQYVLELAKDLEADWPLLPVRVIQGEAKWTVPFILSTGEAGSRVAQGPALQAGLRLTSSLLGDALRALDIPRLLGLETFAPEQIELYPGFSLSHAVLLSDKQWAGRNAVGVLGADIWGHFHVIVDVRAGVVVLSRPRAQKRGALWECGNPSSQDGCYAVHSQKQGQALRLVASVWRDIPEGLRMHLEPVFPAGKPQRAGCSVGVSFPKGDRGESTRQTIPWASLRTEFPGCYQALSQAESFIPLLVEEGSIAECSGRCAFVRESMTGQTRCQCEPDPWMLNAARESRMIDLYRGLIERIRPHLKKRAPPPSPEEPD